MSYYHEYMIAKERDIFILDYRSPNEVETSNFKNNNGGNTEK